MVCLNPKRIVFKAPIAKTGVFPFGEFTLNDCSPSLALLDRLFLAFPMRASLLSIVILLSLTECTTAATKPHVIAFGKWTTVKWLVGPAQDDPLALKVRALYVDGHIREFTLGPAHEITDHLFVVRRVFRLNDDLPQETGPTRWIWQRGGWLLVDRATGHVSPLNLPDFDPYSSVGSWYRDYFAYCGTSDDGKKLLVLVVELGRHKPVVLQSLGSVPGNENELPDSSCSAPAWERGPARVTFELSPALAQDDQAQGKSASPAKLTFRIRGHSVDIVTQDDDDSEASK
jgi:hypothetical protein